MARRRPEDAPTPPSTPRPFTDIERAQIRRIIVTWEERRRHPHPGHDELRAIYIAAGRERPFRGWEIDYAIDLDWAFSQEFKDDSPDAWSPYVETWADRYYGRPELPKWETQ